MAKPATTCALVRLVRARQRAEVAVFLQEHPGADEETIGAALALPVWTVRCRLAELAGEGVPWVRPEKTGARGKFQRSLGPARLAKYSARPRRGA